MKYKDITIFNPCSIRRGFKYGKRISRKFKEYMEAGHSLETLVNEVSIDEKIEERWGLISPIGIYSALILSPINLTKGLYYIIKKPKTL